MQPDRLRDVVPSPFVNLVACPIPAKFGEQEVFSPVTALDRPHRLSFRGADFEVRRRRCLPPTEAKSPRHLEIRFTQVGDGRGRRFAAADSHSPRVPPPISTNGKQLLPRPDTNRPIGTHLGTQWSKGAGNSPQAFPPQHPLVWEHDSAHWLGSGGRDFLVGRPVVWRMAKWSNPQQGRLAALRRPKSAGVCRPV